MVKTAGFLQFVKVSRARMSFAKKTVRIVHYSEIIHQENGNKLSSYIADRAPLFYRKVSDITNGLGEGYFVTPLKEVLARIPTSESFRSSHFGEITCSIFTEEVMGLKKLYSKLSLLTAENSNAYKMDLVLYNPKTDPLEFVFGEVKSSPKTAKDCYPAGHDKSCYADVFNSLNEYDENDLQFDLSTAKGQIDEIAEPEKSKLRKWLKPYANPKITYAGFAIIDLSTKNDDEMSVLGTRKNKKNFDIEVVCIEGYPSVAEAVFKKLEALKVACSL